MYQKHNSVEQVIEELIPVLETFEKPFFELRKNYPTISDEMNTAFDGLLEYVEHNLDHPDKAIRTTMHMIDGSILNPLYMFLDGAMTEDTSLDSYYDGLRRAVNEDRITLDDFNFRILEGVEVTLMFMAGGYLDLVDRNYRLIDYLDRKPEDR